MTMDGKVHKKGHVGIKIDITPKMIEAGNAALSPIFVGTDSIEKIVTKIFTAMWAASEGATIIRPKRHKRENVQ